MRLPKGVVGADFKNRLVFIENIDRYEAGKRFGLKTMGTDAFVYPVGRIRLLQFADNPVYPMGCSPNYGNNGNYETARHCTIAGDPCILRQYVQMNNGSAARVVNSVEYRVCKSWICWVFDRFLTKFGYVLNSCVEGYDNAILDIGNEGKRPDLVLFAGSEDGKLGLFVPGMSVSSLPSTPFRIKIQSVDYWEGQRVIEWETVINGMGIFLVEFGDYVLPFKAFYTYPSQIPVKPGFSGSNAFVFQ